MIYKLCRRFPLLPSLGKFLLEGHTGRQNINFDSHNTQFSALYEYDSNNGYEQEVGVLIDALIPDKGIFYDIGSNWGYFSLFLASRPRYSGQIFAFEPMPDSFSDLQRCVIEAKLKNKVKCHNIAASNKNTELLMVIPDAIHSGSAEVSEAGGNIVIEAKRLDDYNLPAPDFIKIDVEGHELEVLKGMKKIMMTNKPMVIIESWKYPTEEEKTLAPLWFLEKCGYKIYALAWEKKEYANSFYLGSEHELLSNNNNKISLIPISSEIRYLLYGRLNLFACHKDNLDFLKGQ